MDIMNSSEFLNAVTARLDDYVASRDRVERVNPEHSPATLRKTLDVQLPLEGHGLNPVLDDLDTYIAHSVKTHRGEFMNPLWGGLSLPALAGEIIAAATNNSMYTQELSPMGTLIEHTVLQKMCEMVGFSDGFGTLTTGGSNGNMLGMLCAREHAVPASTKKGFNGSRMVVFVSAEAHYSVLMAANVIGVGHLNVVKVACDDEGRMRPDALEDEIRFIRDDGRTPFCVVATAGTTVRGAYDPLRELARISHTEGLWLHVDAAWGGTCMFSPKHRTLMDGVELADSVCWDAHKMMGVALVCSAFLVKQPHVLRTLCDHTNVAHYLFHDDAENIDLGRYSLQCGRRNDALKLWLEWRSRGDAGWASMVDRYMSLADHLQTLVDQHEHLEMMSQRSWTNVCFRFTQQSPESTLNDVNVEIRNRLIKEGMFMVSRSNIGDDVVIRCVISNEGVTEESLARFVDTVVRHGHDVVRGLPGTA